MRAGTVRLSLSVSCVGWLLWWSLDRNNPIARFFGSMAVGVIGTMLYWLFVDYRNRNP